MALRKTLKSEQVFELLDGTKIINGTKRTIKIIIINPPKNQKDSGDFSEQEKDNGTTKTNQ